MICLFLFLSVVISHKIYSLSTKGLDPKKFKTKQKEDTALHTAVRTQDLSLLTRALKMGEDVNGIGKDGLTPLMLAINHNFGIDEILAADPNVDVVTAYPNRSSQTALHMAATQGNVPVMKTLLERGAHVGARGSIQSTPLHFAAAFCRGVEPLQLLVKHGADVGAVDMEGYTALTLSVIQGGGETPDVALEQAKYLVDLCDEECRDVKSFKDLTVLEYAQSKGLTDMIAVLTQAESKSEEKDEL